MMPTLLISLMAASTCWHHACSNDSMTTGDRQHHHVSSTASSPSLSLGSAVQVVSRDRMQGESSNHYISFKRELRHFDDPGIKSPQRSDPSKQQQHQYHQHSAASSTTSSPPAAARSANTTTASAGTTTTMTTTTTSTTSSRSLNLPSFSPSLASAADDSTAAAVPSAAVFENDPIDHRSSQTEITGTESTLSRAETILPSLQPSAAGSADAAAAANVDARFSGSDDETVDHEICDFCIYQGEGNFTSYGYPLNYKSNLNCSYRIQRIYDNADVCELELMFHDFDVPISSAIGGSGSSSSDCREDYLQVSGRRYCGSGWRDKIETIPFPLNEREINFRFVSNERASGRGFFVEVRRKPASCYDRSGVKSCEERHNEEEFVITSPKFPDAYPGNADCSYFVRKSSPSVCALELYFMQFDIESVSGCYYDYLEIDGQKLCGTYLQETRKIIDFRGDQKILTFHSDKQVNRNGFRVGIKQMTDCHSNVLLPAPPSCNVCARDPAGTLVSYNYPDPYRNNLLCTYTIERFSRDMCAVELFFDDFDILPSADCFKDYLQISGQRFCGSSLHSNRKIIPFGSEDSLTMVFRTNDALSSKGFSLKFKQLSCSKNEEQVIPPPAEPTESIHPPPSNMYFKPPVDTGSGLQQQQQQQNTDAQEKQQQQQQQNSNQQQLQTLQSQVTSQSCDYIYTDKLFYLKSENYSSGNYPENTDCSYFVKRNSSRVCYLELSFLRFDVEASAQCQFDYLEINNVRLCGSLAQETTRTYIFDGKEKLIKFHSDASTSRSGYLIKVDQLECDGEMIIRPPAIVPLAERRSDRLPSFKSCNQFFMNPQFEIRSPSFPRSYPSDSECMYYIKKHDPNVCRLEVIYDKFNLQPADPYGLCKSDFLDFNGIRMCGSLPASEIRHYYFPENEFRVKFVSDNKITARGDHHSFSIRVRQLDCDSNSITTSVSAVDAVAPFRKNSLSSSSHQRDVSVANCDQTLTDVTFEIQSQNYPSSYSSDLNCRYTIIKSIGKSDHPICQLEVHFVELEMPSDGSDCSYDYLNFDAFGRMCGSVASGSVKFFPFDTNVFTLTFRSDATRKDRAQVFNGFYLKVRQRECMHDDHVSSHPGKKMHAVSSVATTTSSLQRQGSSTQCGEVISTPDFEVRSPYYPSSYSENVECVYTIKKSDWRICSMELRFVEFDVQESSNCEKDYLLMDGKKLCGKYKANTRMNFDFSDSPEKILFFKSDNEDSRRGFLIIGHQRPCPDPLLSAHDKSAASLLPADPRQQLMRPDPASLSDQRDDSPVQSVCEFCFTEANGVFTSYGYPMSYPGNLNCKYKISPQPGFCSLEIRFEEFDLPHGSSDCSQDYLQVDNVRYCGTQLRGVRKIVTFLASSPHEVVIRFSSDRVTSGKGFHATYSQIPCEKSSSVVAAATAASIQSSVRHDPPDGGRMQQPSPPPTSLTSGDTISVVDKSSLFPRIPCDLVIYDMYFEISSPGYPFGYPTFADCLFSVRRLNNRICSLVLQFNELDLHPLAPDDACTAGDFLQIGRQRLCHGIRNGTKMEFSFESYKIPIRFKSDGISSQNRGFFVNGYQKECSFPNVQFPDASHTRNSYYPFSHSTPAPIPPPHPSIQPPYERMQHQPQPSLSHASSQRHASGGDVRKSGTAAAASPLSGFSGRSPEYPRNHVAKSFLEQIVESQVHVMDSGSSSRRQTPDNPQAHAWTSTGSWQQPSEGNASLTRGSHSQSGNPAGSRVSYPISPSLNPQLETAAVMREDSRTMSAVAGSPEYPNNYVAKALLEQIVETQVRVVDNHRDDGLPTVQFSNHGTRPGIHVNSSYISLS